MAWHQNNDISFELIELFVIHVQKMASWNTAQALGRGRVCVCTSTEQLLIFAKRSPIKNEVDVCSQVNSTTTKTCPPARQLPVSFSYYCCAG